jgi:plastocyanin
VQRQSSNRALAAKPTTHTVTIEGTKFTSGDLTVAVGDSIVWLNKDPYPHTATKAGDFAYTCSIHPSMKGTLHVRK